MSGADGHGVSTLQAHTLSAYRMRGRGSPLPCYESGPLWNVFRLAHKNGNNRSTLGAWKSESGQGGVFREFWSLDKSSSRARFGSIPMGVSRISRRTGKTPLFNWRGLGVGLCSSYLSTHDELRSCSIYLTNWILHRYFSAQGTHGEDILWGQREALSGTRFFNGPSLE